MPGEARRCRQAERARYTPNLPCPSTGIRRPWVPHTRGRIGTACPRRGSSPPRSPRYRIHSRACVDLPVPLRAVKANARPSYSTTQEWNTTRRSGATFSAISRCTVQSSTQGSEYSGAIALSNARSSSLALMVNKGSSSACSSRYGSPTRSSMPKREATCTGTPASLNLKRRSLPSLCVMTFPFLASADSNVLIDRETRA